MRVQVARRQQVTNQKPTEKTHDFNEIIFQVVSLYVKTMTFLKKKQYQVVQTESVSVKNVQTKKEMYLDRGEFFKIFTDETRIMIFSIQFNKGK